jgi:hypothetical protein
MSEITIKTTSDYSAQFALAIGFLALNVAALALALRV